MDGKPMTNADILRALKDEDLAEFLTSVVVSNIEANVCKGQAKVEVNDSFKNGVVNWLKQEVSDGTLSKVGE